MQAKEITADAKQKKIAKVSLVVLLVVFSLFMPVIVLPALAAIIFCMVSIVLVYTYVPESKGKYPKLDKFEDTVVGYLRAAISFFSRNKSGG